MSQYIPRELQYQLHRPVLSEAEKAVERYEAERAAVRGTVPPEYAYQAGRRLVTVEQPVQQVSQIVGRPVTHQAVAEVVGFKTIGEQKAYEAFYGLERPEGEPKPAPRPSPEELAKMPEYARYEWTRPSRPRYVSPSVGQFLYQAAEGLKAYGPVGEVIAENPLLSQFSVKAIAGLVVSVEQYIKGLTGAPVPVSAREAVETSLAESYRYVTIPPYDITQIPQEQWAKMPEYTRAEYLRAAKERGGWAFAPVKSKQMEEFEAMGAGYMMGATMGELAIMGVTGKVVGKGLEQLSRTEVGQRLAQYIPESVKRMFVKYEKVVTKKYEIYPGKTPLKTETIAYGLGPLTDPSAYPFTLAHPPISTKGAVQYWYGYTGQGAKQAVDQFYTFVVGRGPTTPFMKTFEAAYGAGAQQVVVKTAQATTEQIAKSVSSKALAESVKLVSKPTAAVTLTSLAAGVSTTQATKSMMQTWTGKPYPSTAPRVKEEVEYVYYTMPGQVQRLTETGVSRQVARQQFSHEQIVKQQIQQAQRMLGYPVTGQAQISQLVSRPTSIAIPQEIAAPIQIGAAVPTQAQISAQIQRAFQIPASVTPPVIPQIPGLTFPGWPPTGRPEKVGWPGYRRGIRGGWFVREWFMPSRKELLKIMGVKVKKVGKKKKSKRRR